MIEKIGFFIREEPYGFLSNFERTPFVGWSHWGAYFYPTNEHFYQSHKANSREVHDYIRDAPNATIAMVLGRQLEHNKYLQKYMVPNWGDVKRDIMLKGLRAKFANLELSKMLLDTGDAILFENNPEDPYWGIGDGSGENWLGKLIMQVRQEIYDISKQTVRDDLEKKQTCPQCGAEHFFGSKYGGCCGPVCHAIMMGWC